MSFLRRLRASFNSSPSTNAPRSRRLRLEHLDARQMLSASTGDPPDVGYVLNVTEEGVAIAAADAEASPIFAPNQVYSVNPEDRIVAYFDMGGDPRKSQGPECRKLGFGLCERGWGGPDGVLQVHFQPVVDAGVNRLFVATPFGQRSLVVAANGDYVAAPNQALFQFDAYLDARNEAPKATADFVSGWQEFIMANRLQGRELDLIAYIGSPRHDADQRALINTPSAWWDRAYDIILPLLRAGFRSIGFDASAPATPDLLDYELHNVLRYPEMRDPVRDARLINLVGNERIEVYMEAVPHVVSQRTDFPIAVLDWDFRIQDPTLPGTSNDIFIRHDQFTGEIIRILRHEQWQTNGVIPMEEVLLDGNSAAAAPGFFRDNGTTIDGLNDLLFADFPVEPGLPTLVDLDPDDDNPAGVEYVIRREPTNGTLTENQWHDDVFIYTPNPGFTGIDSFEYLVHDPTSQQSAVGNVDLYVNVLPDIDDGGGRDNDGGGRRRDGQRRSRRD